MTACGVVLLCRKALASGVLSRGYPCQKTGWVVNFFLTERRHVIDAPWVPPYFGSYEHLVQELLGNPFLRGGGTAPCPRVEALWAGPTDYPVPNPWRKGPVDYPQPSPWRAGAAGYLVSVLALREAAAGASDAGVGSVRSAQRAIDQFADDCCGTTWHIPWPVPGPGPSVFGLASQLSLIANTLQPGELRNAVQNLAGQVVRKGLVEASASG